MVVNFRHDTDDIPYHLFYAGHSAGPSLGHPSKPQLDDSYSPYNLIPSSESPASPLAPHDSWGQGKNTNDKISNGTNINWPPGDWHL